MFLSNYEVLARLPMGIAATIGFLGPLGVAILHSRRWLRFAFIAMALAGVLLAPDLLARGAAVSGAGLAWGVVSALVWAGFIVLSPRVGAAIPGLRGLALAMAGAALMMLPYALLRGSLSRADAPSLGVALVVAAGTAVLPHLTGVHRLAPYFTARLRRHCLD